MFFLLNIIISYSLSHILLILFSPDRQRVRIPSLRLRNHENTPVLRLPPSMRITGVPKRTRERKHMKMSGKNERKHMESFGTKKEAHSRGLKKMQSVAACRRVQHGDTFNTSTKEVHHFSREKLPQLSMGSEVWGETGGGRGRGGVGGGGRLRGGW